MISLKVSLSVLATIAVVSGQTSEPAESTIAPSLTQIQAAAATQVVDSPLSNVQGVAFNRFYQIWLENTDYSSASGSSDQQFLATQGITLTNYWGVTHPSEPNYAAAVAGDYFGMDNDDFHAIPSNVSTIADLLDTKGISWGEYQEGLPYAGFQGFNYSNQVSFANNYVRKHNPLILFSSVTSNATRLALIKNFTSFNSDLAGQKLPQWAFITPNMTDDGHDTNVTFASSWERTWLTPLLANEYFMNDTLILLTFDESETYPLQNKVFSILIGGAIPPNLKGTTDDTFYNHYSTIASVSANWGLPSLGRWDCNANIFELVANKTGYKNQPVNTTSLYYNQSYPGPLSDTRYHAVWPVPVTNQTCASGQGVLASVKNTWGNLSATYNYTVNPIVVPVSSASGSASASATQAATSTSKAVAAPTNVAAAGSLAVVMAIGMAALL